MSVQVDVLGELEVRVGDPDPAPVDLGGPKPRALVGLLVAGEGRPVPVEHLIDQMWGEDPPARVEVSLQSYVARLRKSWAAAEGEQATRRLRTHAGGYSLDLGDAALDVRRFTDLLREARATGDDAGRLRLLEEALQLWRGRPYAGLGCPGLEAEATRLEELRVGALEDVWDLRLRRGDHAEAVAALEQLTRTHPLHEQWWALLARALYAARRQGEALAALRRAREHLAEELGIDPGPELRRLEEAVLRQDPSLEGPAAPPVAESPPPEPLPAATRATASRPLVGREVQLQLVEQALAAAAAGRGQVVVVAGDPGVGKTRLLDTAAAAALDQGFAVGRGGWEDEGAPPLWGWSRACAAALGTASVLDVDGDNATTASFRRAEAMVGAIDRPTLLVLDDVHWADADSLRLLRRVGAEAGQAPLAVLVGVRSVEAEQVPAVADALVTLLRSGAQRVDLAGLEPQQVAAWVSDSTGVTVDEDVAARLVDRTGGNPFYISELVRLLVAQGALGDPTAPAWQAVPTGVRDVVRHRLSRLDPDVTAVAQVAAVAGRSFDHQVVATAAGLELDVVEEAVEALQGQGLVAEASPGRSRFAHALVRDAVYDAVGSAARARTHAAVAIALERHHVGEVAAHASELAEHYRLAGPAHARAGWLFAGSAAEHAAARSAHDEALRLWQGAAGLQPRDPDATAEDRERLLLGRARALIGLSRTLESWEPVREAAVSAMGRDAPLAAAHALLTVTEGFVWGWRLHPFHDDDAIALWRRVLDASRDAGADGALVARLTAGLAFECFFKPELEAEGTELAESAVRLVRESTADPRVRLDVVQLSLTALLRPEHLDRTTVMADEFVELAVRVGDPARLSAALTGRAAVRGEGGWIDQARSDVVRAADLAHRHRLSQNLMVTGWARAHLLQMEARWDEAEELLAELATLEATLAVSGVAIGLAQLAVISEHRGRLPQLRDTLGPAAPFHPFLREMYALSVIRSGDHDEARRWLGPWPEQPALNRDYLWLTATVVRSWVWRALGDRDAIGDLRDALLPYVDRMAYGSATVAFLGSVAHWVGVLEVELGEPDTARAHLGAALEVHQRHGLDYWEGLSRRELAALG